LVAISNLKISKCEIWVIEKNDVAHPANTNILGVKLNKNKPKGHFIERNRILKYLWSNLNIPLADIDFILEKHPFLKEMRDCISDFRNIYVNKSVTLLKGFVDKYVKSSNKNLKSFANGIFKDFIAAKNSIISEYSNGFIEGNNNRLKMIKQNIIYSNLFVSKRQVTFICLNVFKSENF
jgi:hypothetical protein